MAKPTLGQTTALLDPLGAGDYTMLFTSIPGATIDLSTFALRCVDAVWKGVSLNKMSVTYPGSHTLHYNGPSVFDGELTLTFVEDRQMNIVTALRQWKEYVRGTNSSNSQAYKVGYSTSGQLQIWDTVGALANTLTFTNLFFQGMTDGQFGANAGQNPVLQTLQLSYDIHTIGSVPNT